MTMVCSLERVVSTLIILFGPRFFISEYELHNTDMEGFPSTDWGHYEPCPESKGTKALNMYNIFNLQKRHCE